METQLEAEQRWALLFEQDAVVQLLSHGIQSMDRARNFVPILEPVFTVWSIGAEKLLKLCLGYFDLKSSGGWTSANSMQDYGHGIVRMDDLLQSKLRTWSDSSGTEYIRNLVARNREDAVWYKFRNVLDLYGRSGRFHHLDVLSGKTRRAENPMEAWAEVETATRAVIGPSSGALTIEELDSLAEEVSHRIALSVARWWFTISRAMQNGFLGCDGKSFGVGIDPSMSLPPLPIARMEIEYEQ